MPKDNISSADYYDYIYGNGTEYIDSIASEIESDINDKIIAGEATVSGFIQAMLPIVQMKAIYIQMKRVNRTLLLILL